ncbi:MAG: DMT family transporter [Candidatus Hodarchaeota archaeon]
MKKDSKITSIEKNRILANILLISTTILWGTSFIITKTLTHYVPIFVYLGIRFTIAIIGFFPYFIRIKNINKKIILLGSLTGLIYFFGIFFQTWGIQTTTAGKTAFITGLSTVMVPFITWIGFKKSLNKRIWLAVIISVTGMAFLLLEGTSGVIIGDLLVLLCAILYAFFVVLNDRYVRIVDVYLYSMIQLLVICLLSFGSSLLINETFDWLSTDLSFWFIIIYMGIAVTTLTFLFQNWSQQHQGPSQTAIIFTLEPVFAVIFASFILGNERMTFFGWLGSGLIFIAILITVLKNSNNELKTTKN